MTDVVIILLPISLFLTNKYKEEPRSMTMHCGKSQADFSEMYEKKRLEHCRSLSPSRNRATSSVLEPYMDKKQHPPSPPTINQTSKSFSRTPKEVKMGKLSDVCLTLCINQIEPNRTTPYQLNSTLLQSTRKTTQLFPFFPINQASRAIPAHSFASPSTTKTSKQAKENRQK